MPYYCTVPRCTSMAGKAKNVSFHQFPRDEELAKLWNRILKRGKPYTKYSKVCSLHFRPEDYTITSVGKNKEGLPRSSKIDKTMVPSPSLLLIRKRVMDIDDSMNKVLQGQWRTLRKDAIPSQNLPSESPVPYTRSSPGAWVPSQPTLPDPMVQQQMAQAIYMRTMLAMQAAGASEAGADQPTQMPESTNPSPSSSTLSEIELLLKRDEHPKEVTYKCHECSKCFKDPDVFTLHKRTHKNTTQVEKENFSANIQDPEETLRANPILANLLKTSMRLEPETNMSNILTVENQIMAALASNMEAYIRTLSSMLSNQNKSEDNDDGSDYEETTDMSERDAVNYDPDSRTNNKSEEETKDINERFNVEVTACVSRMETPMDENQVFANDINGADHSMEDCIDARENDKQIEDQEFSSNINSAAIKVENKDNQNASDNSMDTKSKEYEASQNTNEYENDLDTKDNVESIREAIERNEAVYENNDMNEMKMNDETSNENTILENNASANADDEIDDTAKNEAFQDQMCTEDDANTNDVIDENQESNAIDENQELNAVDENKDEICENEGKMNQDDPECDTEIIRIEFET